MHKMFLSHQNESLPLLFCSLRTLQMKSKGLEYFRSTFTNILLLLIGSLVLIAFRLTHCDKFTDSWSASASTSALTYSRGSGKPFPKKI